MPRSEDGPPPVPTTLPPDAEYVELFGGGIACWQPRRGYRFSIDAMLLAMAAFDDGGEDVLELGTGVGVVLLALAMNPRFRTLVGLEVQPELAAFARENVRLNGLDARVRMVEGDLRAPPPEVAGRTFDVVVSNPPYYPVGEGHVNPDEQRAVARHEVRCTLADVLDRIRASLREEGRAYVVYPAPRARAVLDGARGADLTVTTVRFIRSREGYAPRQVLLALRPGLSPEIPRRDETVDLHDDERNHVGPIGDFFRRLEHLAASARTRGQ